MNSQIIVVDDFYDIPFEYHKSFDEGKCLITEETTGKISQILNHPIQLLQHQMKLELFQVYWHIWIVIGLD